MDAAADTAPARRTPRRDRRRPADPLAVRSETLHRLQDTDLARVAGGIGVRKPSQR